MLNSPDPNIFIGSIFNICRNVFVLCRVAIKKNANKKKEQWVSYPFPSINYGVNKLFVTLELAFVFRSTVSLGLSRSV